MEYRIVTMMIKGKPSEVEGKVVSVLRGDVDYGISLLKCPQGV